MTKILKFPKNKVQYSEHFLDGVKPDAIGNFIKRQNKSVSTNEWKDGPENKYNTEEDQKLEEAYDAVKKELSTLKVGKLWTSAKLYELYAYSDLTMDELSKKIGISKSTTFLNIKKIKEHLRSVIENPFTNENK